MHSRRLAVCRGVHPSRTLRRQLADAGIDLVTPTSPDAAGAPILVLTSSARKAPGPFPGTSWLWLSGAPVADTTRDATIAHGAYDVIVLGAGDAVARIRARLDELAVALPHPPADASLALASDAARAVAQQVAHVASTSMSVLFTGETGTGKEVMARLTHAWSARARKPFVPINCAAIPNELMEAELFGYARGAFSGAVQRYDGQLMAASGGTVFLDEIDETSPEIQVKLLRVLEDRVVSRLGENEWHEVDFRLLAATNRDLGALIEAGLFGADLYARLAIVTIELPPLRARLEDLPLLARHFMARFAREQARPPVVQINSDALRVLRAYPWPGNIRELRNVLYETLVYKRAGDEILLSDLPRRLLKRSADGAAPPAAERTAIAGKIARGTMNLREEVAALERIAVEEALARTGGNAAEAARLLGQVGRGVARDPGGTLRAMMRRLR